MAAISRGARCFIAADAIKLAVNEILAGVNPDLNMLAIDRAVDVIRDVKNDTELTALTRYTNAAAIRNVYTNAAIELGAILDKFDTLLEHVKEHPENKNAMIEIGLTALKLKAVRWVPPTKEQMKAPVATTFVVTDELRKRLAELRGADPETSASPQEDENQSEIQRILAKAGTIPSTRDPLDNED